MKQKGIGKIRMVNLTCTNCGASLDLDIDSLQLYCPFCGNRLMIDVEQMKDILLEKERTKQKGLEYKHEKEMTVEKAKAEGLSILWILLGFIGLGGGYVLVMWLAKTLF